jgi:hypothetical protein
MERILAAVPEFGADYEGSMGHPSYDSGGELLFHVVMGDLARFYMTNATHDQELAGRFGA